MFRIFQRRPQYKAVEKWKVRDYDRALNQVRLIRAKAYEKRTIKEDDLLFILESKIDDYRRLNGQSIFENEDDFMLLEK